MHTIRFVTSGVGGVIVGAGFVARGGVDGRSMMSNRSGNELKEQCGDRDSWLRHGIAMQVESENLGRFQREKRTQMSKEKFDSESSMTVMMGGGGAICRDPDLNYVTNLHEKT